jgi:hypothetical protein
LVDLYSFIVCVNIILYISFTVSTNLGIYYCNDHGKNSEKYTVYNIYEFRTSKFNYKTECGNLSLLNNNHKK